MDGIVQMIKDAGALVLFLPPYSPDYSPIEEAFSKVKLLNHMKWILAWNIWN